MADENVGGIPARKISRKSRPGNNLKLVLYKILGIFRPEDASDKSNVNAILLHLLREIHVVKIRNEEKASYYQHWMFVRGLFMDLGSAVSFLALGGKASKRKGGNVHE